MYKIGEDYLSYILLTFVTINRVRYNIKRKIHLHRIMNGTNQIVIVSFPFDPQIDHDNIRMFGEEYAVQGQQEHRTSYVIHAHILKNHVFEAVSEDRISISYHENFIDREDVSYLYQNFSETDVRRKPVPIEKIGGIVLKAIANALTRRKTMIVPYDLQNIPIYIVQSQGLQYQNPVTVSGLANILKWDDIAAGFYGPVNNGLAELVHRTYQQEPVLAYEKPRTTTYHTINYRNRHDFLENMPIQFYRNYQQKRRSISSVKPVEEADECDFETYQNKTLIMLPNFKLYIFIIK